MRNANTASSIPAYLTRAVWRAVGLLVLLGVAAAVGRGVFLADLATRGEPFRQQLLYAFHQNDPHELQRPEELYRFDSRFAAHPLVALLHVVPGGIFLTLALLQFSTSVRSRYLQFHRWSGRVLVLVAFVAGLSGFYFGLLMPYGGLSEAIATALFGGLFLAAISRAFIAVRRHQLARHREWMIRAFAIAIGISTVRVVGGVFDVILTPAGIRPPEIFVISIWVGWLITLGAAEVWVRYTRLRSRPLVMPASAV